MLATQTSLPSPTLKKINEQNEVISPVKTSSLQKIQLLQASVRSNASVIITSLFSPIKVCRSIQLALLEGICRKPTFSRLYRKSILLGKTHRLPGKTHKELL